MVTLKVTVAVASAGTDAETLTAGSDAQHLTSPGAMLGTFAYMSEDEKRLDFELALSLATNHPELFEVAHEYAFDDFQRAIQDVSRPGKTGIVLLKSPV